MAKNGRDMGNPVDADSRKRASEDCALFQQLQYLSREDFVRTSMDRSNQALHQDPCWFGLGRTKSSLQRARIELDAAQESAEQQIHHRHGHCGCRESHPAKVTSRFPQKHSQYLDFLQESDPNHSIAAAYVYRAPQDSFQRAKNHKKRFPSFDGCLEEEEFLEWLQEVEDFFLFYGVSEETKVVHVVKRLKGEAFIWWDQLQLHRIRFGKFPICTWSRMKRYLCRKYVPAYFEHLMHEQYPRNHQNPYFLSTSQSRNWSLSNNQNLSFFRTTSTHKLSSLTIDSTNFNQPPQTTQFPLLNTTLQPEAFDNQNKKAISGIIEKLKFMSGCIEKRHSSLKSRDSGVNLGTQEHLKEVEQPETKVEIQQQQTEKSTHLGRTEEQIPKPAILLGTTSAEDSTPLLLAVKDIGIAQMQEEHRDDFHLKNAQNVASKVEWEEEMNADIDHAEDIFEFVPQLSAEFFLWKRRKKEAFVVLHHMEFLKKFSGLIFHKFRDKWKF